MLQLACSLACYMRMKSTAHSHPSFFGFGNKVSWDSFYRLVLCSNLFNARGRYALFNKCLSPRMTLKVASGLFIGKTPLSSCMWVGLHSSIHDSKITLELESGGPS